jgi:isoleucyl-tRNA synthetase
MFNTSQESFSEREKRILEFWKEHVLFEKSLDNRKASPVFTFYDGPPFATGLPHYGHLLAGTIKDVIPRYKTMKGFYVPRRFGWDCHGLPVENEIEKAQNLAGAPAIEEFGIANFNEECRSIVLRYTEQWKETVSRMGRWVDFENSYKTMDLSFMESVWWVFGQLWDKGLVYQGFKVMPFSAKLGTPLSNFEANLNYQDVDDPSLTVKFKLKQEVNTFLLVWTTTPWTLPSNLAVVVHPRHLYVKIKDHTTGQNYILLKSRLHAYYANESEYEVLATYSGKELVGKGYDPLFMYFTDHTSRKVFSILVDEFVGEEDGTGIVHAAPAFGEMDFFVCQREEIEPVCPVDQNGRFTSEVPEYLGQFVKDADKDIIRRLKKEDKVFKHTQIRHRYPFCYRSDTPLIYKTVATWFVAVEKIKEKLLEANQKIMWMPSHIKEGRFGKWLENARDWAISRNRYWGTPIPLWKSEDNEYVVIRSVEDLATRTNKKVTDLHRHFIDEMTFEEGGKLFTRVPEVFDCWFESGSMPYAQHHYPFENADKISTMFPADFIAEGLDQTRGWFYTLVVLGAALFDKPAFTHAIVNGIILAEDGQKMSKRLKNYPDPMTVVEQYGADAIRLYLLHSPVVQGDDLKFSERGVETVLRQCLIPLWNSYYFLATYAQIYHWKPTDDVMQHPKADIDRWILSLSQKLIKEVDGALEAYDLIKAIDPLVGFIDELTNWYIRRCRSRFWSEEDSQDRREAFSTLYQVLMTVVKIAAPFIPFLSDAIYQQLRKEEDFISVHLCDYPIYESLLRFEDLEYEMSHVQKAVSMGHSLRKEHKIKVRQPLRLANIIIANTEALEALQRQKWLIAEELNVKDVAFFADESAFVTLKILPNYRTLGKKAGKSMNLVKTLVENLKAEQIQSLQDGSSIAIHVEGEEILIAPEDIQVKREVLSGQIALTLDGLTVTLDTELNAELVKEGLAREFVNRINTLRKTEGFQITDRITITLDAPEALQEAFIAYQDYICGEVLATHVHFKECLGTECDLNGEIVKISIHVVKKL